MVAYKGIKFRKGIKYGTLAKFKSNYAGHLKGLSEAEVKECYNLLNEPTKTTRQREKSNAKQGKR